jgi:hypothetical protein
MKEEMGRLERALDASMIVAIGKTVLFVKCWEYLKPRLGTQNQQQLENVKIAVREQFNSFPDDLFFIPPELASTEDGVRRYFQHRFDDGGFRTEFMKEFEKKIRLSTPDLAEFF